MKEGSPLLICLPLDFPEGIEIVHVQYNTWTLFHKTMGLRLYLHDCT